MTCGNCGHSVRNHWPAPAGVRGADGLHADRCDVAECDCTRWSERESPEGLSGLTARFSPLVTPQFGR